MTPSTPAENTPGSPSPGPEAPSIVPARRGEADTPRRADAAPGLRLAVVNIGNTNASFAIAEGSTLDSPKRHASNDPAGLAAAIKADIVEADRAESKPSVHGVVIATVNPDAADALTTELRGVLSLAIYRIGTEIPLPLTHRLSEDAIARTGHDRLLNAIAAYDAARQAVVVADAGTAITVDFVDGEGVFCGGAIAPGIAMSLRALHTNTAVLPEVTPAEPDDEPFGRNTEQAMLQGAKFAAQGLVRRLAERYALAYDAYPMVVATGGDAPMLFGDDELIDRVVPHLALRGIAIACQYALADRDETSSD